MVGHLMASELYIGKDFSVPVDAATQAMGAAMRSASALGLIRRTNHTRKSERVACHRRDLRVWVSLLWREDAAHAP